MRCDECLSEVAEEAVRCGRCGEIIGGKPCPDCLTRAPIEARLCRWCDHRFAAAGVELDIQPEEIRARVLPTFLFRGRFLAHRVAITPESLVLKTPGLFHLWTNEDEIPWNKVSGFRYRDGIVWDRLTVETRGQDSSTIVGLSKADGTRIRGILQRLEK